MKLKTPVNVILGIATEVVYSLFIMIAAFLICLILTFKI